MGKLRISAQQGQFRKKYTQLLLFNNVIYFYVFKFKCTNFEHSTPKLTLHHQTLRCNALRTAKNF